MNTQTDNRCILIRIEDLWEIVKNSDALSDTEIILLSKQIADISIDIDKCLIPKELADRLGLGLPYQIYPVVSL